MDDLVKKMKTFYEANPHHYFQSEFDGTYRLLDTVDLMKHLLSSGNSDGNFLNKVKALPLPVSKEVIELSEMQLGFPLPPLLKELYLEINNGGFGPAIMGLGGGWLDGLDGGGTAIDIYLYYKNIAPEFDLGELWDKLHEGLLPISYAGCLDYYVLDCRVPDGQVFLWDSSGFGSELGWEIAAPSLRDWLEKWLTKMEYKKFEEPDFNETDLSDIPF